MSIQYKLNWALPLNEGKRNVLSDYRYSHGLNTTLAVITPSEQKGQTA